MRWALSGGPTTEASPRASRSTENPALTSPPCSVVTEPDARAVLVLRREDLVRRAASTDGPERQVSFPVSARKYGIRGSCLRRYRFVDGPSRTWTSSAQSHYDRSDRHPLGLVKQAYSAWVIDSVNANPRKWHLTAYFTYSDLPSIPTVDQDPVLRAITVPAGIYRSGKARSRNSDATSSSSGSPPRPMTTTAGASTRTRTDNIVLPSLHSAIAPGQMSPHGQHRQHSARLAEDQRMIQMLNSRPIL